MGPNQTVTRSRSVLAGWSHIKPSPRGQIRLSGPQPALADYKMPGTVIRLRRVNASPASPPACGVAAGVGWLAGPPSLWGGDPEPSRVVQHPPPPLRSPAGRCSTLDRPPTSPLPRRPDPPAPR